jgi:glycosyltransferase involved in cell wall biosynthesis
MSSSSPSVEILYITFNRILYTRRTLPAMIENAGADFALTIIDNGSTDGTVDYLKFIEKKYGNTIKRILYASENKGISLVTNVFWKQARAEFLGKVDNDTLLPPGWLTTLLEAHNKTRRIGVVGGYHFNLDYADMSALEQRVIDVDGVKLIPDAFIGGCCYLFRKSVQEKTGYLKITPARKTAGWTEYQQAICLKGYNNGYLYPLLLVEHFDDPLDTRNLAFTTHAGTSAISFSDKNLPMDQEKMLAWYIKDARRVESGESLKKLGLPLCAR